MVVEIDKPEVLMVTARYFPYMGGIETHVYEVGRRLVKEGINITILTTMPPSAVAPSPPEEEVVEGMRILRVRAYPSQRDYYIAPEMRSIIRDGKWDLIHCQGCHTFVPPLAMWAAKEARIPYMITLHTGGHSSGFRNSIRALQWRAQASLLAHATKVIGVSHYEADYFRDLLRLPSMRLSVIANGITVPTLNQTPAKKSDSTLIISIGRLERYKGHQRIIRAMPYIRRWRSDARLLILGAGPYEGALRALIRECGVEEYVEMRAIPPGKREEMAETVAQASLVALLSDYEAHPIAVMEALALKRPVLGTDTSGTRELAEQGFVRTVSLDSSPEEVARAVQQQIEEPIVPAENIVLPTWDDCANRVLNVYNEVLIRRELCVS